MTFEEAIRSGMTEEDIIAEINRIKESDEKTKKIKKARADCVESYVNYCETLGIKVNKENLIKEYTKMLIDLEKDINKAKNPTQYINDFDDIDNSIARLFGRL